jgi:hypothetical protein
MDIKEFKIKKIHYAATDNSIREIADGTAEDNGQGQSCYKLIPFHLEQVNKDDDARQHGEEGEKGVVANTDAKRHPSVFDISKLEKIPQNRDGFMQGHGTPDNELADLIQHEHGQGKKKYAKSIRGQIHLFFEQYSLLAEFLFF